MGGLYRQDLETGETVAYDHGPGRSTMEAVFVPASEDSDETDGWLLSYVHDANVGRAELVLLDAADFGAPPVARVLLPARVPHGFHGNWIPTGSIYM
jgi:carotenoid cleavage dioxygenase